MSKNGRPPKKNGSAATQFKVGWKGGPGRPKIPWEEQVSIRNIKRLRGISAEDMQTAMQEYRTMSTEELVAKGKDLTLPHYRLIIIRAFINEAKDPTFRSLLDLRTLIAGPETKSLELSGPGGIPFGGSDRNVRALSDDEIEEQAGGPDTDSE